jgi:hypothetical protein
MTVPAPCGWWARARPAGVMRYGSVEATRWRGRSTRPLNRVPHGRILRRDNTMPADGASRRR